MDKLDFIESDVKDLNSTEDADTLTSVGSTCVELIGKCNGSLEATWYEKTYSCIGIPFVCGSAAVSDGIVNIHNERVAQDVSAADTIKKVTV